MRTTDEITPIKVLEVITQLYMYEYEQPTDFQTMFRHVIELTPETLNIPDTKRDFMFYVLKDVLEEITDQEVEHETAEAAYLHFIELLKGVSFLFDESGEHLLMNYSKTTQIYRTWNKLTTQSRGIIIDLKDLTFETLVHPYDKFYNMNEVEATRFENLPDLPYEDAVKLDGSEGNFYIRHDGTPAIVTKGSFNSTQGEFGTKQLYARYARAIPKMVQHYRDYSFVFEIIYDSKSFDRVVVSYPESDLKLIGVRDLNSNKMLSYAEVQLWGRYLGVPYVQVEHLTPAEMEKALKERTNFEGFVRCYLNGERVKMKCEEYILSHRARFGYSHRSMWWMMYNDTWDDVYASYNATQQQFIDERLDQILDACRAFEKQVNDLYASLPKIEDRKEFAAYVNTHVDGKMKKFMFNKYGGGEVFAIKAFISWKKFRDLILVPHLGEDAIVDDEDVQD